MKKVFATVLAVAICAAASTMVRQHPNAQSGPTATDGAFRDGLFLGHLDAAKGRARHVCVGRWSATSDRGQFAAGYEAGYAGE